MDIGGRLGDTPPRRGWLFGMGVMGFGYRLYPSYANLPTRKMGRVKRNPSKTGNNWGQSKINYHFLAFLFSWQIPANQRVASMECNGIEGSEASFILDSTAFIEATC
jgi:hypothetical protein